MENRKDKFIESLIDLGLKDHEAKVYLACLELGQATVGKIADQSDVQRTFVYDILDNLAERGIVSSIEIKNVKHFSAISAERLKNIQLAKFENFEALVPDFKAFEKTVGDRPRVRFFEGPEGIKTALYDTLNQPSGSQILSFGTGEGFYETEPKFISDYLQKRIKKRIMVRAIAADNVVTREYISHNKEQLRTSVLIPEDKYPFTNEINIYQNKMLILSLQGELLAVIIESESVAKTQRSIFELSWLGAQNLQK